MKLLTFAAGILVALAWLDYLFGATTKVRNLASSVPLAVASVSFLAVSFAIAAGFLTAWNVVRQLTQRQDSWEFLSRQVVALGLVVVGLFFAVVQLALTS